MSEKRNILDTLFENWFAVFIIVGLLGGLIQQMNISYSSESGLRFGNPPPDKQVVQPKIPEKPQVNTEEVKEETKEEDKDWGQTSKDW
jgi:hypothetical protein